MDWKLFWMILVMVVFIGCGQESEVVVPVEVVSAEIQPELTILIDGLQNPVGIDVLADGGILIAEEGTGERDTSAGVFLVAADGSAGRLISGLPSGRDSGDLSGVPFVKVSPDGGILYTSYFGAGRLLTLPLEENGRLTVPDTPFMEADLGAAMLPLNAVQLGNPFDVTFDWDGVPVVSDATGNGVAKETAAGETHFIHRFEQLPNPVQESDRIDAVPTGIERVRNEYFVTLTGGCPYPAGSGRLVAIDEERNERTVLDGLDMPIDVATAPDGTVWVLEFARFDVEGSCFSGEGYLPHTGRLSRVEGESLVPVLTELNFPGGMAFDGEGAVLVSEVFAGRILTLSEVNRISSPLSAMELAHKLDASITVPPQAQKTLTPVAQNSPTSAFFVDEAAERGIDFMHGAFVTGLSADPIAMMGAGVCWIDFDDDGWLDLYLVNSYAEAETAAWAARGGLPGNGLYRNAGGQFEHVPHDLVVRGNGCVAADFDLDGRTDLYVTADGANQLLWNEGGGVFREGAAAAGVAAEEWSTAAAVADVNGDGWPDMFVAAYIDLEKKVPKPVGAFPQDFFGLPDHLYVNNGDGTFRDVILQTGMVREERGLGALFTDLDLDGDLELYIANDGQPNRLYSAEFTDTPLGFEMVDLSLSAETGDSGSGMGVAGGDYNGDGLFDLFVTNWDDELNALYRNEGGANSELLFRYTTYGVGISGLGNNVTAWGTSWADFDHDTDQDLLVVHGHVPITDPSEDAQLVRFYGNRLAEGMPNQWRDWTGSVGLGRDALGVMMARGSAVADFDNDGDLDVGINVIGGAARLLVNTANNGNYLQIAFDGFAPNARATVTLPDGRTLVRELHVGSSYLASEDPRLHFGLGEFERVEQVVVRWADGEEVLMEDIAANQVLKISRSP